MFAKKRRPFATPLFQMLQVEKTPVSAVLSTGNDTRQHIKMGHTLRAASRRPSVWKVHIFPIHPGPRITLPVISFPFSGR